MVVSVTYQVWDYYPDTEMTGLALFLNISLPFVGPSTIYLSSGSKFAFETMLLDAIGEGIAKVYNFCRRTFLKSCKLNLHDWEKIDYTEEYLNYKAEQNKLVLKTIPHGFHYYHNTYIRDYDTFLLEKGLKEEAVCLKCGAIKYQDWYLEELYKQKQKDKEKRKEDKRLKSQKYQKSQNRKELARQLLNDHKEVETIIHELDKEYKGVLNE